MSPTSVFRFIPGPWSPCSATCGPGKQTREVKCQVLLSFTQTEVDLPEEECGEDRPLLERPCNGGLCTVAPGISPGVQDPGDPDILGEELHHWDYRGFTTCSATCAAGEIFEMCPGGWNPQESDVARYPFISNSLVSLSCAQGSRQQWWGVLAEGKVTRWRTLCVIRPADPRLWSEFVTQSRALRGEHWQGYWSSMWQRKAQRAREQMWGWLLKEFSKVNDPSNLRPLFLKRWKQHVQGRLL